VDAGTIKTAHAVVAVATYILQVVVGLDDSSPSWGIDGKGNPTLSFRVCLSSNRVISFKVFGMNHTVRVRVALLPSEACAGKKRESNSHISHIKKCLLQPAVAATAKVPCRPVGGAAFLLFPIKGSLVKSLSPEVILLLAEMGRDISYGRRNAKDLMECRLDGHDALGRCRSNSGLDRGNSSPVASVELWINTNG